MKRICLDALKAIVCIIDSSEIKTERPFNLPELNDGPVINILTQ